MEVSEFENSLRYQFKDKELLKTALSHSSYANENKKSRQSNERLEFLGDSVLSLVVSRYLYDHFSHLPEGELTKIRASLVCEQSLYKFALELDLGKHLLLGKGEDASGGRERPSILSDAFEAVIAAIYLDGEFEAAQKHILRFIPAESCAEKAALSDYKTILQEIIQQNPEERVEYHLIDSKGPDHAKIFSVEVRLNSNVIGKGEGHSKKQAEQNAACEALKLMGYEA